MTAPVRARMEPERAGITRTFRLRTVDEGATELAEALRENERLRTLLGKHAIDPGAPYEIPLPPQLREFQFYVHANLRADGTLGEIFIKGDRLGGFQGASLDALAMAMSIGLQYGVPLSTFLDKLRGLAVGPSGRTGDAEFPMCSSMFDLLAQFLAKRCTAQIAREKGSPP